MINDAGVERRRWTSCRGLLKQEDAVIWVDIPVCDTAAVEALTDVFGFHRRDAA